MKTGVGTDLPRINPDLKEVADPITGERMIAVRGNPTRLRTAACDLGRLNGKSRLRGIFLRRTFRLPKPPIAAAERVAQVDEIVGNRRFSQDPFRTDIPHFMVDRVVEAPFGAYPCSSHGNYQYDEAHLAAYVALSRESEENVRALPARAMPASTSVARRISIDIARQAVAPRRTAQGHP